jgi:transposase
VTRPGSRPQRGSRPTTAPPSKPPAALGSRHRLNPRGNPKLNHALHLAAVTQVRHDTPGRAYYQHKIADGKSKKEALRTLKRRISDAVWRQLPPLTTRAREDNQGRLFNPAWPAEP